MTRLPGSRIATQPIFSGTIPSERDCSMPGSMQSERRTAYRFTGSWGRKCAIAVSSNGGPSICREATGFWNARCRGRRLYRLQNQGAAVVRPAGSVRIAHANSPAIRARQFGFNDTLMDSAHAGRYLVEIEKYPQVAMYETPIPQNDPYPGQLLSIRFPSAQPATIPTRINTGTMCAMGGSRLSAPRLSREHPG